MENEKPKPGYKTTEFYGLIGVVAAALAAAVKSGEVWVQVTCILCLTLICALYMLSRLTIKTKKKDGDRL